MTKILPDKIFSTDYKSRYSERSLNDLFKERALIDPSKIILHFHGQKFSYHNLVEGSNKLAWFLLKHNIKVEERVGVALDRSPDLLIALLGIVKAGAAYVPLDPEYPRERVEFMVQDSSAKILLTSRKYKGTYTSNATELYIEDFWDNANEYSDSDPEIKIDGNNLAYVLYTSGSTGVPKGVQIEHHSIVNLLTSMQTFPGITADDVFLAVTTVSFDIAGLELFLPLVTGALLVLTDAKITRDGRVLLDVINQESVTMIQATPSTYRMMLEASWVATPRLKVLCCGEPMTNDLAAKMLQRCGALYNMYGPTETTIYSSGTQVISADETITIGLPIENTQIYILDENNEPVAKGETGEICIGGDGLSRGYLNQPDLTREKFITNTFAQESSEKLYRTGDLGKILENDTIQCFGRIDHQIKINGYRIELGEIEYHVSKQANVKDAIVVAREDIPGTKYLVAYIIADQDDINLDSQIQNWKDELKNRLPKFMVPSSFVILDEFPLMHNGKIDRSVLPKPETNTVAEDEKPLTDVGKRIADIWRACIGIDEISIYDDFFDIGGNSIIAVKAIIKIEKEFDLPLPLAALFEFNTIAKLTQLIESKIILPQAKCLVPIRTTGSKVPLYIVHGGGLAVFCFKDITKCLGPEQPVYALQAMGVDGLEAPLKTVEEIAARYITEILEQNPDGPYALGGYSLGGVIAFEMVKQFRAMGKKVTTLAMFDSYAYAFESDKSSHVFDIVTSKSKTFFFRVNHLLSVLRNNPRAFLKKLDNIRRYFMNQPENLYNLNDTVSLEIYKVYETAVFNYKIDEFDGAIELFCSKNSIFYTKQDPIYLGWKTYSKKVRRYEIMGNHYSMFFHPNVSNFAKILQSALDNGSKQPLA